MKVLILANAGIGLYKFRRELIEELVKGHQVYIALPNGDFINQLKALGCIYINVEFSRRGMNPFHDIALFRKYLSIIKNTNPDVVLTYTVKPNIYGGIVCRIERKRYLINITGLGTAIENPGLLQKVLLCLYRLSLKCADCVFFQNSANRDFFAEKKMIVGRYELLPGSGVNIYAYPYEIYPEKAVGADKFLFLGRIMRDKGIRELLEASAKIKQIYPDVQFDIVGGSDEDFTEEIQKAENAQIITYWGPKDDVIPFLKECSAVVLPSYHEGMSNVLLEASATGRPVLASDIPGCREAFEEGVTGIGFKPKDADSLYHALERFIQMSYEEKSQMGKAARKKMETEFDRGIVVETYMKELERII